MQFILAMEKRILTDRFAMRFATTVHGILFTDAFFAYRYFNNPIADFREELSKLAYALMHNPEVTSSRGTTPPKPKKSKQASRTSPNSGGVASDSSDGKAHPLVKMKVLPGWVGGKDGRQRCIVCNKKTIWCCLDCSEAPHALMPLCPVQSNKHGEVTTHLCYEKHCADPSWMPRGKAKKGGAKRRRASFDDAELEVDEDCDECESEVAEGEEEESD